MIDSSTTTCPVCQGLLAIEKKECPVCGSDLTTWLEMIHLAMLAEHWAQEAVDPDAGTFYRRLAMELGSRQPEEVPRPEPRSKEFRPFFRRSLSLIHRMERWVAVMAEEKGSEKEKTTRADRNPNGSSDPETTESSGLKTSGE